jgi:hypothetical protein
MRCGRLVVWMNDDGRRRQGIPGLAGVLVTLISLSLSSAQNDEVTLTVDACPDVATAEIERILGIELRSIAAGKKEVNAAPTRVTATCKSERVLLRAVIAHPSKSFFQTVPLAKEADENERLIAIAAAELVFSAWVDASSLASQEHTDSPLAATDSSSSRKTPRGPASGSTAEDRATQDTASKTRLPLKLEIGLLWRMYWKGPSHFFGGELSLKMMPKGPLYVRASVALEGMRVQRPVGRVSLFAVSGAIGLGVLKPMLKYLVLGAELGGRFGLARLKGESSDDNVEAGRVKGGFGGPVLGLFISSSTSPYAVFAVELGYALYGNIGHLETSRVIATTDIWVSAGLAVGLGF